MHENYFIKLKNKKQHILLFEQQKHILDLERFKKSVLEGNYTNHENQTTKQANSQMVEQRKKPNLGL